MLLCTGLGSVANRNYLPLAHANCDIRVPGWLTVALGDITREAVLAAIAEYDRLGQEAFLHRHGFDRARQYVLLHDGKRYDSKAIVGVAHGYLPGEAMLTSSEFSGGRATVGRLLTGLGFHVEEGGEQPGLRPGDWTESENRAIVDDYLVMLSLECAGKSYNKTEHRNALIELMGGTRSPGSIERKHQNISAVMLQLGLPYIRGYKPLSNIQEALLTEVRRRLDANPAWFAELQPQQPSPAEARFSAVLRQVRVPEMLPEPHGRKVDYGLLQEESKRVGDRGEEFVFNFEKAALEQEGRSDLAADVLWVAREIGDGAGYDIRSYRPDGRPRYIEVKATKLGAVTPFYITSAELHFARRHQQDYAIYRVFDVDGDAPEFYVLEGDLDTVLAVEPVTYRARPHASPARLVRLSPTARRPTYSAARALRKTSLNRRYPGPDRCGRSNPGGRPRPRLLGRH